jgi:hypothetical protein
MTAEPETSLVRLDKGFRPGQSQPTSSPGSGKREKWNKGVPSYRGIHSYTAIGYLKADLFLRFVRSATNPNATRLLIQSSQGVFQYFKE